MRTSTLVLVSLALVAGCGKTAGPPDIPFADSGDHYSEKMDFARVELRHPLGPADLMKLTPENLETLNQEQLDQIYARLSAGPIPDGAYDGNFFFADGSTMRRLPELMGGIGGGVADKKLDFVNFLGERLWKGKVFFRDERVLRNMINDRRYLETVLDFNPDELEKVTVEGKREFLFFPVKAWLLFPAKLYCGQSMLDSRRESVIIDYAFNDDIEGYQPKVDYLVGRGGLRIRDEIRMIRPGFYLGRAYMGGVFALNFVLYNEDVADAGEAAFAAGEPTAEDCWTGTQARPVVASR